VGRARDRHEHRHPSRRRHRHLSSLWAGPVTDSDVRRFSALSVAAGTPYRDHAVEYAQVELGVIRLIGSGDIRATATRLVIVCFLLDLLAFAGMWSGRSRRTAITYLWLGVPLLVLTYLRLWYLPVALSVWAFALMRKRRPSVAGVVAALAVFAKLWPIALAPAFVAETRRRSLAFVLAGVAGGIGWLLLGGIGGVRQVLTFRSATGWEIESTVGSLDGTKGRSVSVRRRALPGCRRWCSWSSSQPSGGRHSGRHRRTCSGSRRSSRCARCLRVPPSSPSNSRLVDAVGGDRES
jgi:hypothetical protein